MQVNINDKNKMEKSKRQTWLNQSIFHLFNLTMQSK